MRSFRDPILPFPIDLSRWDETTCQQLYDIVVAVHFTATAEERQAFEADPENHWIPTFSPEDAGLVVFAALHRWWATWLMLDEPADRPEARRRELLRITPDPGAPYGVAFHEA